MRRAVRDAWRATPALLAMKLWFELRAFAWAFVPIYGLLQGLRHRLFWAMASNVLVFEGLSGEAGRARCRALVEGDSLGLVLRTLNTIPLLLTVPLAVGFVGGTALVEADYSVGLWLYLAAMVAVVPGLSAVNTFLYLQIVPLAGTPAGTESSDAVRTLGYGW
jgi:hypothetical protein